MSSSEQGDHEATRKELEILRKSYLTLHQEHQRVLEILANCKCNTKQDPDEPAAKRQRLEDPVSNRVIPTDPLKLPEPCAMRILQFLAPKELMEATNVSKEWKNFIESRKKLIKPAMDGIVVNLKLDQIHALDVCSPKFMRKYNHMNINFNIKSNDTYGALSSWVLYPALKRKSMLKSLDLTVDFDIAPFLFVQRFPKLVELKISTSYNPFRETPSITFPALTTLIIKILHNDYGYFDTDSERFTYFLQGFPNLQHLQIESEQYGSLLMDDDSELGEDQPKLKTIAFNSFKYFPAFVRSHQTSLQNLLVHTMYKQNLSHCLRDLKQLKCLTIIKLRNDEIHDMIFPQNESIEVLTIGKNWLPVNDFHEALIAFPSLKELAVKESFNPHRMDLRFLAANMANLKSLKIGDIKAKDLEVYNEIKQNANQYINTTFELTNDDDVDYQSFPELEM